MGQKQGFLNLLKNLGINFFWIGSIMKIYISYFLAQIPYLGTFLSLRYGPTYFQPINLQDFLINSISRANQWNRLTFCMLIQIDTNYKLIKNVLVGMVKYGFDQSCHRILKLTVSQEWIYGKKWLFASWCKLRKAKYYFNHFWVGVVKNGHGDLVMRP